MPGGLPGAWLVVLLPARVQMSPGCCLVFLSTGHSSPFLWQRPSSGAQGDGVAATPRGGQGSGGEGGDSDGAFQLGVPFCAPPHSVVPALRVKEVQTGSMIWTPS